jgi:L-2-hydroxyglutarate oxidase LhgO
MLYDYCESRNIPARRIGKLIVATTPEQVGRIEALARSGAQNGVTDLVCLEREAAKRMEPEVECLKALYSPSTGIVDSHAFMLALQGDAEAHGAQCVLRTRVEKAAPRSGGFDVHTDDMAGSAGISLSCRNLLNCAGLGAQEVATNIEGYPRHRIPPRFLAKGNYASVSGATPFSRLIYPVPVKGGLGIHLTLDFSGGMRLGPDLHWIDKIDYTPDQSVAEQFYALVSSYWPGVMSRELRCNYCGIRPKISGPGDANADFLVEGPAEHGIAGLVNFFGIESPGLTSSLALAEHAAEKLGRS